MSETDRELIELAAKAVGMELRPMCVKPIRESDGDGFVGYMTAHRDYRGWFDPLSCDADALALAVGLNIDVDISDTSCDAWIIDEHNNVDIHTIELVHSGQSKRQAVRRAITRASAELANETKTNKVDNMENEIKKALITADSTLNGIECALDEMAKNGEFGLDGILADVQSCIKQISSAVNKAYSEIESNGE